MHSGIKAKDILSLKGMVWSNYINEVIDTAVAIGKSVDKKKFYGDYDLLLGFFNGNQEMAGNYFMLYCTRVSNCPPDFLEYCERVLLDAGVALPQKPTFAMPKTFLGAAE